MRLTFGSPLPRRSSRGRPVVAAVVAVLAVVAGAGACSSTNSPATQQVSDAPEATASSGTEAPAPLVVLVSNDDGVGAPGIDALVEALRREPAITVVVSAPATNQSGTGGTTTPGSVVAPAARTASGFEATGVEGTPADSVNWALDHGGVDPDLVIAGVNLGQNLGPVMDLSGTVGAARAAAQRGIPAVAVSAGLADDPDFDGAAAVVVEWLRTNRQSLATGEAPVAVTSFNQPSCTAGQPRGVVEVPAATDAAGRNVIGPSDCTSTTPAPADDVDAFTVGFTTRSELPLRPAA